MVVVLHGCGQTAAGYDLGAGWSTLAKHYGFALLMPEQQSSNNANGCFNWFNPEDTARDSGEACSIRQMIARMAGDAGIDARRIFVTGLSAGGAMTSVMLATSTRNIRGRGAAPSSPHCRIGVRPTMCARHSSGMVPSPSIRPVPNWAIRGRNASNPIKVPGRSLRCGMAAPTARVKPGQRR